MQYTEIIACPLELAKFPTYLATVKKNPVLLEIFHLFLTNAAKQNTAGENEFATFILSHCFSIPSSEKNKNLQKHSIWPLQIHCMNSAEIWPALMLISIGTKTKLQNNARYCVVNAPD